MKNIKVIAFDIDGTLYPDWRLYIRISGYFLKNLSFFLSYNRVRKILHRTAPLADFYEYQARLLAIEMNISIEDAKQKIETIVYKGLTPYLLRIKPYKHVEEAFINLKKAGYRLAILSDFPPEQKGDIWGLQKYCEIVLGSESIGALKPSVYTFGNLADDLKVTMDSILYVGNSIRSDIKGAKNAGMKTAYLVPLWRRILHKVPSEADILFANYRQFQKSVLN